MDERQLSNDLQIGDSRSFETWWHRVERTAWALMTFFVLLGVIGAFGGGWASKAGETAVDGMTLDYERLTRFGSSCDLILSLRIRPNESEVRIVLSQDLAESLELSATLPGPATTTGTSQGVEVVIPVLLENGRCRIRFRQKPTVAGILKSQLEVSGHGVVDFRQFVFP